MNPAHLSLSPSYFVHDLPALDHASPSSSSFSRGSSEWSSFLHGDSSLLTPGSVVDAGPAQHDYFGYATVKLEPETESYSWEVYQPTTPQRFPSTVASPSSLLLEQPYHPSHPQAHYPSQPSHALPFVALPPQTPAPATSDIDDVVFAMRYPATRAASKTPAAAASSDGSRNKQACVFCQSGRRRCDGNKDNLTACSVCSSSGRQCCWTKVKRLRGPNRARGKDGQPVEPASAVRVRAAGSLLRRIEQQQKQQQESQRSSVIPSVLLEEPVDFLGADGWEPSSADGFQVSSDVFVAPLPSPAYCYPATPRRPTQDLPSVPAPELSCTTFCGLATPFDDSELKPTLSAPLAEAVVRRRLERFTFPPKMSPSPELPTTPSSASHALSASNLCAPPRQPATPSLKRWRADTDDAYGGNPSPAKLWSSCSPAAIRMNEALALDIAGQRLHFSQEHVSALGLVQ